MNGLRIFGVPARHLQVVGHDQADEFRARADVQLLEDLAQVVVNGARAEEQPRGCLPVARALPDEACYLEFLRGELISRAVIPAAG